MGNANTTNLEPEEVNAIARETSFSVSQIHRLYSRFVSLDKERNGFLNKQNLLLIPELAINPLGDRIVNEFFRNCGDEMNFRDFISKLKPFRKQQDATQRNTRLAENRNEKLQFLFGMYDLDRDNRISREELLSMLQLMVGQNITFEQMQNIGDRTLAEADLNDDGSISFEEFKTAFENIDIEHKMSIKFLG